MHESHKFTYELDELRQTRTFSVLVMLTYSVKHRDEVAKIYLTVIAG